jgi:hypothetical protein
MLRHVASGDRERWACARTLAPRGRFELIIDATGALTIDGVGPEKRLRDLNAAHLGARSRSTPSVRRSCVEALHSAVASDVALPVRDAVGTGGQHRRQSQERLVRLPRLDGRVEHMLLRTAAIEACRQRREAVFATLHP